jgi:hypothetical protein
MVVATKRTMYINQLTENQQAIMRAGQRIQQTGGDVTIEALCAAIKGSTTLTVTNGIKSLRNKGYWCWTEKGKMLPASQLPLIGWGEGSTDTGTGTGTGTATRATAGRPAARENRTAADNQADREFVLSMRKIFAELPEDTQARMLEREREFENSIMSGQ